MMNRFAALIVCLVLIGCGAVTEPFGMEDPFAVPQPFAGAERNELMLKQATEVSALLVELPQGLSEETGTALRDRLIKVAHDHDIPALPESTVPAWVLSSQNTVVLSPAKKKGRKPKEQGLISWRLTDVEGNERALFTVGYAGNADALSGEQLRLIAEQAVVGLDKALTRPRTQAAEQQTVSQKPVAWIAAIIGAPGDGNKSLARALQGVLPLKGIAVDSARERAAWRIEGRITVVKASATQDVVTLTWRVIDAKGTEAGSITQENAVPRGRLSKAWGEVAGFAAEAAAEGIAQLIQQVSAANGG